MIRFNRGGGATKMGQVQIFERAVCGQVDSECGTILAKCWYKKLNVLRDLVR